MIFRILNQGSLSAGEEGNEQELNGGLVRNGHLGTWPGKKVLVLFRNGRKEIDKFLERKRKHVFFERIGKVAVEELRCVTIYRAQPEGVK